MSLLDERAALLLPEPLFIPISCQVGRHCDAATTVVETKVGRPEEFETVSVLTCSAPDCIDLAYAGTVGFAQDHWVASATEIETISGMTVERAP